MFKLVLKFKFKLKKIVILFMVKHKIFSFLVVNGIVGIKKKING